MKFISEINEDVKVIVEEKEGKPKSYFIEGIFMQAVVPNRNRRYYPESVLDREVERYMKEHKTMYGELGHPEKPNVNLDRVSHYVRSLTKEGTDWIGRAEIATTPYGQIARNLIDDGAQLGVSSRGMGTLKEMKGGISEVQDDFRLIAAADIVADPSAPNAFVRGIMEGVEWTMDEKTGMWVQEHREEIKKELDKLTVKQIQEQTMETWEKFLKIMSEKYPVNTNFS